MWGAVITLRAKEDFLGGSGLLTNGPYAGENMVFHPRDSSPSSGTDKANSPTYPSKGFPRTQVNVKPYHMVTDPTVDVRYLGESIDPRAALEDLFTSAEGEMRDLDHLLGAGGGVVDEDIWNDRDGSGYYYEYVRRYLQENTGRYDGADLDADFELFLTDLLAGKEVTLPYSFLPAVPSSSGHEHGTQTGGDEYEKDVLGQITYRWEAVSDGDGPLDDEPTATTINNTAPKRYRLTVTYTPSDEGVRQAEEKKLIQNKDTAYMEPKAPVGTAAKADSTEAVHTTYVVSGQLAVKVRARKEALETYMAGHDNKLVVTVAMEKDGGGRTEYPLTLTADDLTDLGTGEVELALTDEAFQDLAPGEYTLSLVSTTEQYFTHFSQANTGDYTPESFSEGYIPAGTHLSGYIAPAGTTAEANTVSFKLGDLDGAATIDDARADLADTLAKWVDKKLEGHRGDTQAALNALDLDPSWAEQNDDFALPAYLNARLGMGVGEVTISPPVQITLKTSKTVANGENNNTMAGFDFTLTQK